MSCNNGGTDLTRIGGGKLSKSLVLIFMIVSFVVSMETSNSHNKKACVRTSPKKLVEPLRLETIEDEGV